MVWHEIRAPITCFARLRRGAAVARSPDLATRPTEGPPEKGAGVKETFGPARGGVWRPAPSTSGAQRICEVL